MKKSLLLILFAASHSLSAQFDNMNFEQTALNYVLSKVPATNNAWQVGAPQKTLFTTAHSAPNVIVTSLTNPYPVNDTSYFLIKHAAGPGFTTPHTVSIDGWYYVDSDNPDVGTIEFSPNNGVFWINLISPPPPYNQYVQWGTQPLLFGNSGGWKNFNVYFAQLGPAFNIQYGDTVVYRFSFKTDALQTNQDGLMYDNFIFEDYTEGVEEFRANSIRTHTFPNPATDKLTIDFVNDCMQPHQLDVYNSMGAKSHSVKLLSSGDHIDLDVSDYPAGAYLYKLHNTENGKVATARFIKTN